MAWKHSITYTHIRGKVRANCVCGQQSRKLTREDAWTWAKEHTGLKEKSATRKERS